ncbi:MAG: hypothetical protein COZ06_33315 [Armatimonadetes bacterium CG_4_10_14_3_um_filter_66_18]|nr:hypothetical protein [Armatimonadota bacterium]OIO96208.1 MAG: hypothetical protein AUJ96_25075 [Armatimonadetes bacterium CG2_30_66_41]PIU94408.1 MAG: hypothetical protein COS65_07840 [Armatimonadetes bacterium CG06_land_8_20_14_3_00_66_21]PIX46338.1 MAG: hypothetical protein COZ57_12635 [Armatimonadetes bacterium CG_4_8_14_3_um_filter_66_20]PIY37291.1 MAG: hypothetical protein COZ06_33315 [Armatimonadetes bacterium CG_4_10_14_3_um_filter_66_18]PIZ37794.1 MAG: hypothetical protein COY42_23
MTRNASTYEDQLATEIRLVPPEFLPNLLAMVRLFRDTVSLAPAEESFRRGWAEAVSGETHPIADLWENLGDNTTG